MKTTLIFLFSLIFLTNAFAAVIPIKLEHAVTEQELARGLMGRTSLPPDHGMTFNYAYPQQLSFWMYNTLIDLSLAFLDEKKTILEIHELKAYPSISDQNFFHAMSVKSKYKAKYALEMNKDWFEKHGVKPGDKAVWDISSPDGNIITKEK